VNAVDTNVIVRYLTRDDEEQFRSAQAILVGSDVFVLETVLLEAEWVLRYAYSFPRSAIADAFRVLLGLPNLRVADDEKIAHTIEWHEKGLDFADALHLAGCQEMDRFVTFDQRLVKRSVGIGRCEVAEP